MHDIYTDGCQAKKVNSHAVSSAGKDIYARIGVKVGRAEFWWRRVNADRVMYWL
jgi:hypothetical protein